jgi:RNA polymerase sigma-70 factor (sigma-E family)
MLAMARGLVRREADAEDLVQDVLASALLKWARVSAAHDPDAYVNRMLVNAATSWWRRPARREHPSDTEVDRSVDDPATASGERAAVLAALRRLPARHRAVLVLRYYEGMQDAEIADVLGVADATVRSCARRGLAALRASTALHDDVDAVPR